MPSGDRFYGDDLHLAVLDIAGQGAARKPQRGEPQQSADSRQRVGEQDLSKAARGAVVFDEQRQANDSTEQQYGDYEKKPETESGFPGQQGDGEQPPEICRQTWEIRASPTRLQFIGNDATELRDLSQGLLRASCVNRAKKLEATIL